jgi:hypothetical protein
VIVVWVRLRISWSSSSKRQRILGDRGNAITGLASRHQNALFDETYAYKNAVWKSNEIFPRTLTDHNSVQPTLFIGSILPSTMTTTTKPETIKTWNARWSHPIPHDNLYYGKCIVGGILSCGITHTAIVPLDGTCTSRLTVTVRPCMLTNPKSSRNYSTLLLLVTFVDRKWSSATCKSTHKSILS